jgi:hypothetical protein
MIPRPVYEASLVLSVMLSLAGAATAASEVDLPSHWSIHAGGPPGALDLVVEPSGEVSGQLLGQPVRGFIAGRHLVLHRSTGTRLEVWDGWLASGPDRFIAGTITVHDGDATSIQPWYGRSEEGPEPEVEPDDSAGEAGGLPLSPAEGGEARGAAPGAGRWDLSGLWNTSGGRAEISQDGRTLTVVLPDGTRQRGRFTAADTIVVGIRKGCCKGKVQGPDLISWSDGAVWRRVP